ncbi:phage baseplate upper protein [Bacillus sp. 3103sda1]|uniref:BppU family phage baseplate upper protein n=1 Tax=Bacillus sp. 3103sda1 TaxID=2953808 RepID=UPI00209D7AC2|nr:BppU family phage baseplate upper protein [Bacillus sp. 3103sda1]MCP1124522.1 phage baseplate upper protein [Bacillus sp. 3103sda1]
MIVKTYEINLDLINNTSLSSNIRFSQNDQNTAKIIFNVKNNGEGVDLSNSTTVRVSFKKPDGTRVFQEDCEPINPLNGKYQIILKTQTLAALGNVIGQVHIGEDTRMADTQKFMFLVDESLSSDEAIESTNEFNVIQKAIEAGEKFEGVDVDKIIEAGEKATATQDQIDKNTSGISTLNGINENKFSYTYKADGSVDVITEKDKTNAIVSTTTFTYLASGDVDTSVKVMNGQTVTTKYNYDTNGNLTSTVNTKA